MSNNVFRLTLITITMNMLTKYLVSYIASHTPFRKFLDDFQNLRFPIKEEHDYYLILQITFPRFIFEILCNSGGWVLDAQ